MDLMPVARAKEWDATLKSWHSEDLAHVYFGLRSIDDYLRDPVTAVGMYECIPPLTIDAFLDPDKIDKCITGRQPLAP